MDLEDLIKGRKQHKHGYNDHHGHGHDGYRHDHHHDDDDGYMRGYHHSREGHRHGPYNLEMIRSLYHSSPHKKALVIGAIISVILLMVIGIALLWALLPLAATLVGYLGSGDIQGLLKSLMSLVPLLNG